MNKIIIIKRKIKINMNKLNNKKIKINNLIKTN